VSPLTRRHNGAGFLSCEGESVANKKPSHRTTPPVTPEQNRVKNRALSEKDKRKKKRIYKTRVMRPEA
jgi:hypothetical protein